MACHWKTPKNKENSDDPDQVVLFVKCCVIKSKPVELKFSSIFSIQVNTSTLDFELNIITKVDMQDINCENDLIEWQSILFCVKALYVIRVLNEEEPSQRTL